MRRSLRRVRSTAKYLPAALAAFVGISAANVASPMVQVTVYMTGLGAVLASPRLLPREESLLALLAAAYVLTCRIALGVDLDGAFRVLRPCFEGFLLAAVLFKWCGIRTFGSAITVLAGFVALQLAVALAMGADQPNRLAFIEAVYGDESYQNTQFAAALLFRGYGLSRHHLYGFSLAAGLAAALMLVWVGVCARQRLWLGAAAAAGMLLVAVNARIGFLPIILAYAGGTLLMRESFYLKHISAVLASLLIPVIYFGTVYLGDNFEVLSQWLAAGFEQFSGDMSESNTLTDLNSMFVLSPDIVEWLFGIGRACGGGEACDSDIGFIRAIQEGGVILLGLVITLYWRLNQHTVNLFRLSTHLKGRRKQRAELLVSAVMHLTFFGAMIKGEAFGANDYSRMVVALGCIGIFAAARRGPPRVNAQLDRGISASGTLPAQPIG
jgi:hypothetical protein